MIQYYQEKDFFTAKAQKKKLLAIYFVIAGLYVLFSVGMFLWYRTLPYKSPKISLVKGIEYSVSVLMVLFSFIYLGIPVKRAHKFYKKNYNMIYGLKEVSTGSFLRYDESLQEKDGVDFKALVFLEWSKYKKEFFERKVLVFEEKEFPVFTEKTNVRYVTQGNVLINYTILDENLGEQQ